jgi:2-dehydropantoate 2-reductase
VKSYDTEQAIKSCLPAIGTHTTVLTLQNGLGNIEALRQYLPASQVLVGTTAQGATLLGHGRVRHAGRGETVIGALAPEEISRAEAVREVFQNCGMPAVVSANITAALWGKLLVNAGINALTAILQIRNGRVEQQEQVHAVMRRAVLEGADIAALLGIELPYADPVARTEEVCRATAANISSMLQDIRSGRRTEIDSINGIIASYGRRLGIATPVNSCLACLVASLESAALP